MVVIRSFRELDVYRLAGQQAKSLFEITRQFPKEERYSLTDQIRRSSRAVNAMIAEAWARRAYRAVFVHKLSEALGEASETQAWLDHSRACGYIDNDKHRTLNDEWQRIGGMLHSMIQKADDFCGGPKDKR